MRCKIVMCLNCCFMFAYPKTYVLGGNQSKELGTGCFALQVFVKLATFKCYLVYSMLNLSRGKLIQHL